MITALKILSLLLGTILGALGTATRTRQQDGSLTKWGVVALLGIALSGIVAITSEVLLEKAAAALEQEAMSEALERQERLLNEINRAVQPLPQKLRVTVEIRIPVGDRFLDSFAGFLRETASGAQQVQLLDEENLGTTTLEDLRELVLPNDAWLQIFHRQSIDDRQKFADLVLYIARTRDGSSLWYEPETDSLRILIENRSAAFFHDSGRLASLPDFSRAWVRFSSDSLACWPELDPEPACDVVVYLKGPTRRFLLFTEFERDQLDAEIFSPYLPKGGHHYETRLPATLTWTTEERIRGW